LSRVASGNASAQRPSRRKGDTVVQSARASISVALCRWRSSVEAKPTGTECDDLQETAGHCDILEEVDELALVSQVAVEAECRRHREDRQNRRDEARTITDDQCCAAENFDNDGNGKSKRSEGQAGGCDVADRGGGRGELREPGNQIDCAEQYPPNQRCDSEGDAWINPIRDVALRNTTSVLGHDSFSFLQAGRPLWKAVNAEGLP